MENRSSFRKLSQWIVFCLLFVMTTGLLYAQGDVVVLLKGTVKDQSGNPVEVELGFRDAAGDPVRAKSDKNGVYQAVLKPGQKYTVIFNGKDVLREITEFNVDATDKYLEVRKDFSVRKLGVGTRIFDGFAFEKGSSSLKPDAQEKIKELIDMLNKNRNMTITVAVFGDMPDDPSLQQPRQDAITAFMAEVKSSKKRIVFINSIPFPKREEAAPIPDPPAPDPKAKKDKKKSKNEPPPPPPAPLPPIIIPLANCIISVGEQMNLFD